MTEQACELSPAAQAAVQGINDGLLSHIKDVQINWLSAKLHETAVELADLKVRATKDAAATQAHIDELVDKLNSIQSQRDGLADENAKLKEAARVVIGPVTIDRTTGSIASTGDLAGDDDAPGDLPL